MAGRNHPGPAGRQEAGSEHAAELSAMADQLRELGRRLGTLGDGLAKVEGGESVASDLHAVQNQLAVGGRRLDGLLRRLR